MKENIPGFENSKVMTTALQIGIRESRKVEGEYTLQEEELSLGVWFRRDEIPGDYSGISLTGEMIEYFRAHGDSLRFWKHLKISFTPRRVYCKIE